MKVMEMTAVREKRPISRGIRAEEEQTVCDEEIIRMFSRRDEDAVRVLGRQYGRLLRKIAMNILSDRQDAEEVLNDSLLQVWNSIPPEKPANLPAFLIAVTRANAIDLFRKKHAEKRRSLFEAQPISELTEIASDDFTDEIVDRKLLAERIGRFLRGEKRDARVCFVLRYYYMDSVSDISKATGFSASRIKTLLFRTRNKLKKVLEKEGYML